MSEPAASAASTAAGAAGLTIGFTGTVFGLDPYAVLAGFAGALIAQTYVPPGVGRVRAFMQLFAAGGISGYFTPIYVAVATKVAPWPLPQDALNLAVGAGLGIVAPMFVPLLRWVFEKFAGKVTEPKQESGK